MAAVVVVMSVLVVSMTTVVMMTSVRCRRRAHDQKRR
jgi:hypothetical protein